MNDVEESEQLIMMPPKPPKGRLKMVALADIVGTGLRYVGPKQRGAFVQSIRTFGVQLPVVLIEREVRTIDGRLFDVQDGQRRIRALIELSESTPPEGTSADEWGKQWAKVPAQVFQPGEWSVAIASVHANEQRGDNAAVTLRAIEALLNKGATESQMVSMLGMPVQRVRRLMGLTNLEPNLRRALDEDAISETIAEQCAKLPDGIQERLADMFKEHGHLTGPMIKEARTARRVDAMQATLPTPGTADPFLPAPAPAFTWRDLLAGKITECIAIAHSYNEPLVEAHLRDAHTQLQGLIDPALAEVVIEAAVGEFVGATAGAPECDPPV